MAETICIFKPGHTGWLVCPTHNREIMAKVRRPVDPVCGHELAPGSLEWFRQENERLRRALREISLVDLSSDGGADLCMCNTFQAVAREALKEHA
jgi:hypothetical protein